VAVSIDFLANVSKFLRGTDDAQGALDDVASSLDDLAADARSKGDDTGSNLADGIDDGVRRSTSRLDDVGAALDEQAKTTAGQTIGDELRDGVSDGTAKAESAIDGVEGKFRELARAAERDGGSTGTALSSSVKHGTHEAEEGVRTMKENTASNLKEVAASFDGTFEGAAGGAQGLIAEIAEGFGPVGLIAGAVAAGGLGLILTGIGKAQEKTDEYKQDVSDLATELIDTGRKGGRSLGDIGKAIEDLATTQDGTNLVDIWKDAQLAGTDYKDAVIAIASSNPEQIDKVIAKLDKLTDAHDDNSFHVAGYASATDVAAGKVSDANARLRDKLKETADKARDAEKAQELAAKAGLTDFAIKQGAVDQLKDAFKEAAGGVDDYLDKESGIFNVDKYLRAMEKRQHALQEYAKTLEESDLSPEAKAYIESLGEEQAAALMAGYKGTTKANQHELDSIWTTAGRKSADSYGDALGGSLGDRTVNGPHVRAPSTYDYEQAVKDARARAQQYLRDHPLQAGAVAYDTHGKPIY
jgi:hypothetical protein